MKASDADKVAKNVFLKCVLLPVSFLFGLIPVGSYIISSLNLMLNATKSRDVETIFMMSVFR
jgi:hypothetical protein